MKITLIPATLLFLCAAVSSCKKSSDSPPENNKPKLELLTQSAWKYDLIGLDDNKDGTIDVPDASPCKMDDVFTFKTNNSCTIDEGANKCASGNPQTWDFSWTVNQDTTQITFTSNIFSILKLDDQVMKLYLDENLGGTMHRFMIIYKH